MKGPVPEFPNVTIDNFEKEKGSFLSTCFFLTHCHTDHTNGLASISSFIKRKGYYLHCSSITRTILLKSSYGIEDDCINVINGTQLVEVPGNDQYEESYFLSVSLIPAGHCIGSVMFLLECAGKTVLFTGDFRIMNVNVLSLYRPLKCYLNGEKKIDKIYYDGTFYNKEKYENFISTFQTAEIAKHLIKTKFQETPNTHIEILTSAEIGYEDLFIELAKEFKCKIHVDSDYYKKVCALEEIRRILTKNIKGSQIHYYYGWNMKKRDLDSKNNLFSHFRDCFKIHFSAKRFTSGRSLEKITKNEYCICYATHSSFSEVEKFLEKFHYESKKALNSTLI